MVERWTGDLDLETEALAERILDAAFEVHSTLGPGLLERAYQAALALELGQQGCTVEREVPVTLSYKGNDLGTVYRIDLLVEGRIIVELKATDGLAPVHGAQVVSQLRAARLRLGLLLNFGERRLKRGIRRIIAPRR